MKSATMNTMHGTEMKKLHLSSTDKKISGLCGGIGEYFEVDSTLVRLAWIVMTILTGLVPGVIAYIVASVIVPEAPAERTEKTDTEP